MTVSYLVRKLAGVIMPANVRSENANRQGLLDGLGIAGNVTLKFILKKQVAGLWIGCIVIDMGTNGGLL
jgi:hypothetical protein